MRRLTESIKGGPLSQRFLRLQHSAFKLQRVGKRGSMSIITVNREFRKICLLLLIFTLKYFHHRRSLPYWAYVSWNISLYSSSPFPLNRRSSILSNTSVSTYRDDMHNTVYQRRGRREREREREREQESLPS